MKNRNDNNAAITAAVMVDLALYNALRSVFIEEAFCAQALTKALKGLTNLRQHPFVTSAFYGVLDNNVRLEKLITSLCDKTPDKNSAVVLKIGLYYCGYADLPDYAAVSRAVELAKRVGVFGGFVNAVLKRSIGFVPEFASALEEFSYKHNVPEWLCAEIIKDFGESRAASILDAELPKKTHIRPISKRITAEEFNSTARSVGGELTDYGCYADRAAMEAFAPGTVAVQSVASVRAVRFYKNGLEGGAALDLCAAPGGKSVYLSSLGNFDITACDIYPHKIELMRGYAKKYGVKLDPVLNDATKLNTEFVDKFDLVIADCPCSGTGTLRSKPDIMIKRTKRNIAELCKLQSSILAAASQYCKIGGILCYSTCSILRDENDRIKDRFAAEHGNYEQIDELRLMPDTDLCDGFYVVRFKRTE